MLSFITLYWFFNIGYVPEMATLNTNQKGYILEKVTPQETCLLTEIGGTIEIYNFHLSTFFITYSDHLNENGIYFTPIQAGYILEVGYKIFDGFEIEAYHKCQHPIDTVGQILYNSDFGETKFLLKFNGKAKIGE